MYGFVSCQTFAGAFDLGMVQAGYKLAHKVEQEGGFGMPNCLANRHLLGHDWQAQAGDHTLWEPVDASVVTSNPPCSGYSVMTDKKHRGMDAKVNKCMHVTMSYSAKIKPQVVIMESVRSAFSKGRPHMQMLREQLEEESGLRYDMWHVMQNARDLGGEGERPRYFLVLSQVPFGVEWPVVPRKPSLIDIIGDLQSLGDTWNPQPYRLPATWFSAPQRAPEGVVDGHKRTHTIGHARAYELMNANGGWPEGWWISKVAEKYYNEHGSLPPLLQPQLKKLLSNNFHMGYIQLTRWDSQRPARVITGGALQLVMHPYEPRTITHREAARVMGFPDNWVIKPLRGKTGLAHTWGKGITVVCGRWIGEQVTAALDGHPGSVTGELIGEREYFIKAPKDPKVPAKKLSNSLHILSNPAIIQLAR